MQSSAHHMWREFICPQAHGWGVYLLSAETTFSPLIHDWVELAGCCCSTFVWLSNRWKNKTAAAATMGLCETHATKQNKRKQGRLHWRRSPRARCCRANETHSGDCGWLNQKLLSLFYWSVITALFNTALHPAKCSSLMLGASSIRSHPCLTFKTRFLHVSASVWTKFCRFLSKHKTVKLKKRASVDPHFLWLNVCLSALGHIFYVHKTWTKIEHLHTLAWLKDSVGVCCHLPVFNLALVIKSWHDQFSQHVAVCVHSSRKRMKENIQL